MTNWEIYVRESYDLIKEAESELMISLTEDLEAYIVRLFASFMDKPVVNDEPVGVKLLSSRSLPLQERKTVLRNVGDECLLVHSMEWGKSRWPTETYYMEIGQAAYVNRAFVVNPPEGIFDDLALEFHNASRILRKCRVS